MTSSLVSAPSPQLLRGRNGGPLVRPLRGRRGGVAGRRRGHLAAHRRRQRRRPVSQRRPRLRALRGLLVHSAGEVGAHL